MLSRNQVELYVGRQNSFLLVSTNPIFCSILHLTTMICSYPPADEIPLPVNPDAPKDMPPIAWCTSFELRGYSGNSPQWSYSRCSSINDRFRVPFSESDPREAIYYSSHCSKIGRVLAELENQGLASNNNIVLWADHGWKLREHNMWMKMTNLEDDTHIPFLLRVPGVTDGGMCTDALVELIPIFDQTSKSNCTSTLSKYVPYWLVWKASVSLQS